MLCVMWTKQLTSRTSIVDRRRRCQSAATCSLTDVSMAPLSFVEWAFHQSGKKTKVVSPVAID